MRGTSGTASSRRAAPGACSAGSLRAPQARGARCRRRGRCLGTGFMHMCPPAPPGPVRQGRRPTDAAAACAGDAAPGHLRLRGRAPGGYARYVLLESGARGPYMPAYLRGLRWSEAFTRSAASAAAAGWVERSCAPVHGGCTTAPQLVGSGLGCCCPSCLPARLRPACWPAEQQELAVACMAADAAAGGPAAALPCSLAR
jgi:hypothetical protein